MHTRSRRGREQSAEALPPAKKSKRDVVPEKNGIVASTGGQRAPAARGNPEINSTNGPSRLKHLQQPSVDIQESMKPLQSFLDMPEDIFNTLTDAELLEAAQSVADIWHAHDCTVRATLSAVLGPLLAREEYLSQRKAAITTMRQARRDKLAQQGPRVTRSRAGDPEGDQQGRHTPELTAVNNFGSRPQQQQQQLFSKGPCTRAHAARLAAQPHPPSPLLNNTAQLQHSSTSSPPLLDCNGDQNTASSSRSSSAQPGTSKSSVELATHEVATSKQRAGAFPACFGRVNRRKLMATPCPAALQ